MKDNTAAVGPKVDRRSSSWPQQPDASPLTVAEGFMWSTLFRVGVVYLATASAMGCTATRFPPVDLSRLPTVADYPEDGEIVLSDESLVRFDLVDDEPVFESSRHLRVRNLSTAGILDGTYGSSYSINYEPGAVDLLDFEARVLSPFHVQCGDSKAPKHCDAVEPGIGRLYERGDADEYSRLSKNVETNEMTLHFQARHMQVGSVFEVFHRSRYRDAHLRGHNMRMGGYQPTLLVRVILDMPADWHVETIARQRGQVMRDWHPEVSTHDGRRREVWTLTNVPAIVREPYRVDLWNNTPTIFFRLRSWRDTDGIVHEPIPNRDAIGAFFAREIRERQLGEVTPDIRQRAREIVGEAQKPIERARLLHDWVRWRIRYTNVSSDFENLLPHRSADVLERRHGRGADMALLLKTLLAAVDIESDIVYLYRHSLLTRADDPPTILWGANGVGVQVHLPEGPMWAFPGERTVPFGRVPGRLQRAKAIRCADPGMDFEVRGDPALRGTKQVALDLRLQDDGSVTGRYQSTSTGIFADYARDLLAGAGRRSQRHRLRDYLEFDGTVKRITRIDGLIAHDPDAPIVLEGQLVLGERIETDQEGVWVLRPSEVLHDKAPHLLPGQRFSPVAFGNPRNYEDHISIELPDGWAVEVPPNRHLVGPHGEFRIRYSFEEQRLMIKRQVALIEVEVLPRDYGEFVDYWAEVRRMDARPIVVHRRKR